MEPFKITLEQVTFTPSDNSLAEEDLDSFSNIVCYDHELVDGAQSIKSKTNITSPHQSFHEVVKDRSLYNRHCAASPAVSPLSRDRHGDVNSVDGEEGIINIGYQVNFKTHLVHIAAPARTLSSIACTNVANNRIDSTDGSVAVLCSSSSESGAVVSQSSPPSEPEAQTFAGVHSSRVTSPLDLATVNAILERLRMVSVAPARSRPTSPGDEQPAFTAFASTTEALALQRSVIGIGACVQPASPDEIARVLALTQQRLVSSQPTTSTRVVSSESDYSSESQLDGSATAPRQGLDQPFVQTMNRSGQSRAGESSAGTSSPPDVAMRTAAPPDVSHLAPSANNAKATSNSTSQTFVQGRAAPSTPAQGTKQVSVPHKPVQLLVQTSVQSSHPELIVIPNSGLTVTKDTPTRAVVKTYATPSEEMKNKLRAKAKSHGKASKRKPSPGLDTTPSDRGDYEPDRGPGGRITPSESGDSNSSTNSTLQGLQPQSSDTKLTTALSPALADDSQSEVTGLGRLVIVNLDTSDLVNHPLPVSTSTPFQTPAKSSHSSQSIASSSKILAKAHDTGDVAAKLMREKAHLEGQVEMLKMETQVAVRERADLQAQLGAFKSQFKSSSGSASAFRDRENLLSDIQGLKSERDKLSFLVQNLQKTLDEKTHDYQITCDDLQTALNNSGKLQERIDGQKKEVNAKHNELEETKKLYSVVVQDLQTLRQEKRSMENQSRAVQNEINAMTKTKDWYQQQLKTAQDTRSNLQKEVSKLQMSTMEQSSSIERLKSDNMHIKQQLADSQQRALQEKELLVKHLERIEADMLEREAAVQQLQSDQALSEGSLYEKIRKVEEEKHQLSSLVMTTADLESEIAKLRNDLAQKDGQISVLEHDHAQMIKHLTLSQESAGQREKDFEALQVRFVELEAKSKELLVNADDKNTEVLTLKDQKAALEVALSSANDEKRAIDTALETLREDMGKAENSFRQMKTELTRKNECLREAVSKNESLEAELHRSHETIENQRKSFDEFNESVSGKFTLVNDLSEARDKLSIESTSLSQELNNLREMLSQSNADKTNISQRLTDSENREKELFDQLGILITEKAKLESDLNKAPHSEDLIAIQSENESLKKFIEDLTSNSDVEMEKKRREIAGLESEMMLVREQIDDLKARHTEEMRLVGDRLREAGEAQRSAEWQVAELNKQLAVGAEHDDDRTYLHQQIDALTSKLAAIETDRDRLQTDLATLSQIAQSDADAHRRSEQELRQELAAAHQTLDEYKFSRDESLKLALELEREKGRLSGVMQGQAVLKQHTSDLEEALAEKESSLVDITLRTQQKLNEMSCHSSSTAQKITEMESCLTGKEESILELKKQIGAEKLQTSKLRKKNESLQLECEQLRQELEETGENFSSYKSRHAQTTSDEERMCRALETSRAEYDLVLAQVESLNRQLEQTREKDPVVNESLKTLQWEIDQKNSEMIGWRQQMELAEKRQQLEIDAVRKALQSTKDEVDKLRSELQRTRKDKFGYQAKLSEVRGTVKACLRGKQDSDGIGVDDHQQTALVNGETPPQDAGDQSALLIIDRILDDSNTPEYDSKPLAALHQCMSSLRNQMSGLQKEIDQHSAAVLNTSQSWQQVETQVKELRDLCSSDDCSARSDAESAASNQTAEDMVEMLIANQKGAESTNRHLPIVTL